MDIHSANPRKPTSRHLLFITGTFPKAKNIMATGTMKGENTLDLNEALRSPFINSTTPSVMPLNRLFTPKNRSKGGGDRPKKASSRTSGFWSRLQMPRSTAEQVTRKTGEPSERVLASDRFLSLFTRFADDEVNWNGDNAH